MGTKVICAALLIAAIAGCSVQEPPKKTLSERQRDSLIGESVLPGAGVVKRAMVESDAQTARAAAMDSLMRR